MNVYANCKTNVCEIAWLALYFNDPFSWICLITKLLPVYVSNLGNTENKLLSFWVSLIILLGILGKSFIDSNLALIDLPNQGETSARSFSAI